MTKMMINIRIPILLSYFAKDVQTPVAYVTREDAESAWEQFVVIVAFRCVMIVEMTVICVAVMENVFGADEK